MLRFVYFADAVPISNMSWIFLKHPILSATPLKTVYKLCFKLPQAVLLVIVPPLS